MKITNQLTSTLPGVMLLSLLMLLTNGCGNAENKKETKEDSTTTKNEVTPAPPQREPKVTDTVMYGVPTQIIEGDSGIKFFAAHYKRPDDWMPFARLFEYKISQAEFRGLYTPLVMGEEVKQIMFVIVPTEQDIFHARAVGLNGYGIPVSHPYVLNQMSEKVVTNLYLSPGRLTRRDFKALLNPGGNPAEVIPDGDLIVVPSMEGNQLTFTIRHATFADRGSFKTTSIQTTGFSCEPNCD